MSSATHATDARPRFPGTSRALSALRSAIRRGRTGRPARRAAAREIAAYPATRSAALAVLPARHRKAT